MDDSLGKPQLVELAILNALYSQLRTISLSVYFTYIYSRHPCMLADTQQQAPFTTLAATTADARYFLV